VKSSLSFFLFSAGRCTNSWTRLILIFWLLGFNLWEQENKHPAALNKVNQPSDTVLGILTSLLRLDDWLGSSQWSALLLKGPMIINQMKYWDSLKQHIQSGQEAGSFTVLDNFSKHCYDVIFPPLSVRGTSQNNICLSTSSPASHQPFCWWFCTCDVAALQLCGSSLQRLPLGLWWC
jgi:hypothetical protein